MTDSHTHLTSEEIFPEVDRFIQNFVDGGGTALLNVAHNLESINQSLELHRKYRNDPRFDYHTSLGLHPDNFSANSFYGKTFGTYESARQILSKFKEWVSTNIEDLSAIGETGLDYYRFPYDESLSAEQISTTYELQKLAFRTHLEIADEYKLPLTIHTREIAGESRCIEEALKIVSEVGEGRLTGSFHSYTGDKKHVEDILNLGFYLGFNGIVTYSNAENVRDILREVPIDRVLLETDAPFLPPRKVRSNKKLMVRHGQPADIAEIAEAVAEVKALTYEEVLRITSDNFKALFIKQDSK